MSQSNQINTITDLIKPEFPTLTGILSLAHIEEDAAAKIVAQELSYLEEHASKNPWIMDVVKVAPQSIKFALRNVLRKNLSLDPNAGLIYLKKRNQKIQTLQGEKWITVLEAQETSNGLLSYNRQIGAIYDHANPQVTKDASGKVIGVSMELQKAGHNGSARWEKFEYDESDFKRWATYSHKENSRGKSDADIQKLNYANALYRSWNNGIDPEFARAKCIRHSLKKLGSNPNEIRLNRSAKITEPYIDPVIANAEAADNDITYHEEVSSEVHSEPIRQQTSQDFNAGDL